MARASVTTQTVPVAGLAVVMAGPPAVSPNGDICDTGDHVTLRVFNGGGAPINVTITGVGTVEGNTIASRVVAVAAGATTDIPLPRAAFAQTSGADAGRAYVDYSAVTSVTRAVYRTYP